MAWQRILAQVLISAGGVVSKAFVQAYQQAVARTCVIVPFRVPCGDYARPVPRHGRQQREGAPPLPRQRSFVNPPHTHHSHPFLTCVFKPLPKLSKPSSHLIPFHLISPHNALALLVGALLFSLHSIALLSRPPNHHALPPTLRRIVHGRGR